MTFLHFSVSDEYELSYSSHTYYGVLYYYKMKPTFIWKNSGLFEFSF